MDPWPVVSNEATASVAKRPKRRAAAEALNQVEECILGGGSVACGSDESRGSKGVKPGPRSDEMKVKGD